MHHIGMHLMKVYGQVSNDIIIQNLFEKELKIHRNSKFSNSYSKM